MGKQVAMLIRYHAEAIIVVRHSCSGCGFCAYVRQPQSGL